MKVFGCCIAIKSWRNESVAFREGCFTKKVPTMLCTP